MDTIKTIINENLNEIEALWKKLHHNPELSFKEYNTQKIILDFFNSIGIEGEKIAKTGVIATLGCGNEAIALRSDIDAISVNGVSHACGHDFHMAITLGTALILKKLGCNKTVKFLLQPAEEAIGGAVHMIEEGALEAPKVKALLGFHVWPKIPVGKIEITGGPSMASVDDFHIIFKGIGGHAATPHLCRNPLYPAMDFINAMTIKSKLENNPLNPHILTFATLNCGSVSNVISNVAEIKGTLRTFDNDLRYKLKEDILNVSKLTAEKYGCESDIKYTMHYPPLITDKKLTKEFVNIILKSIGSENILPLEKTFASEDFSYYCEKVPCVHFRLGIADGKLGENPLHSPIFNGSMESLFWGIYILTTFILNYE